MDLSPFSKTTRSTLHISTINLIGGNSRVRLWHQSLRRASSSTHAITQQCCCLWPGAGPCVMVAAVENVNRSQCLIMQGEGLWGLPNCITRPTCLEGVFFMLFWGARGPWHWTPYISKRGCSSLSACVDIVWIRLRPAIFTLDKARLHCVTFSLFKSRPMSRD